MNIADRGGLTGLHRCGQCTIPEQSGRNGVDRGTCVHPTYIPRRGAPETQPSRERRAFRRDVALPWAPSDLKQGEPGVKRLATLLAISGSLLLLPTAALAKGNVAARGYAVITGPRLVHPIVLTAPWNRSRGGYYGNEAEVFLHLAESSGAIPAGRDLLPQGGSVPDGVVPLRSGPSPASLGPVYRLTWFRNGLTDVVNQEVYPYASGGP